MKVFEDYARYYNLLNNEKDYNAEVNYVVSLIKQNHPEATSILNLGCGTGKHDILFAGDGFSVTGVDLSEKMIQLAKKNQDKGGVSDLVFIHGDVRDIRLNRKYDVVVSLFHVMSYQVSNNDLEKTFITAKNHLNEGGCFIFDTWHGPGVLTDLPTYRDRQFEDDTLLLKRHARPVLHSEENVVDVNYSIEVINKLTLECYSINELHKMRYLFTPELKLISAATGFNHKKTLEWMTEKSPDLSTWNAVHIFEAL